VRPADRSKGLVVENKIVAALFPANTFRGFKKGIQEAVLTASSAVIPLSMLSRYRLRKFHEVDSNELAFKMAADLCHEDGFSRASQSCWTIMRWKHHARRISGRHLLAI